LNYLLFAVYLLALCWLLLRIPFIKRSGIDNRMLVGLFLVKTAAGIAIGWLSLHFYGPGNDYWDVNREAWNEYQLMITDPGKYVSNIFTSGYPGGYSGLFNSYNSYWNDLRGNILIKLVSLFNIFSRGDYYINSLFFNFIVFFGHVLLYRLFIKLYPGNKIPVIIGCFLLPSMLYFSSGIHKDGLVFLMLSLLIYILFQYLQQNRFTVKRLVLAGISLLLLFAIRNYILLALLPALIAWGITVKTKMPALRTFGMVYLLTGILFFTVGQVFKKMNPPEIVTQKQAEYLRLQRSDTQVELNQLQPNFSSFAANAPQALNHILLRPYLWELPSRSLLPLNIELAAYQVLLLLFLFFRRKDPGFSYRPFILFTLFLTLTLFLLIGYIVPNLGSIIRYRSLYLPMIITPLLCSINWSRIKVRN